jgi:outer membrane protein TolC
MTKKALLAAFGAGLALAGCNLAPHYERPQTDSSGGFKEAVPNTTVYAQGWKLAEPNDAVLRGNWWELYHDRQLNDLEERVAISNQTIIAAEANYRVARAMVGEAQASLFPTLSVAPSVIRSRSSASGSSGGSAVSVGSTTGTTTSGGSGGGPCFRRVQRNGTPDGLHAAVRGVL